MEDSIGWTLSTMCFVMRIDPEFKRSMHILDERFKNFPRHHTLLPCFLAHMPKGISTFFANKNKKKGKNNTASAGLMTGGMEAYKMPGCGLKLLLCLGTKKTNCVVPVSKQWCIDNNIVTTVSIMEVICNALSSVLEICFFRNAKEITQSGIDHFNRLMTNMRAQTEILYYTRSALEHKVACILAVRAGKDEPEFFPDVFGGVKSHTGCHWSDGFEKLGGNSEMTDNEQSEKLHRLVVSEAYATTSKLPESVPFEMLRNLARIETLENLKSVAEQCCKTPLIPLPDLSAKFDGDSESEEEIEEKYNLRFAHIDETKFESNKDIADGWQQQQSLGYQKLVFDSRLQQLRCENSKETPSHCDLVDLDDITAALYEFRRNLATTDHLYSLVTSVFKQPVFVPHATKKLCLNSSIEISLLNGIKNQGSKQQNTLPFIVRSSRNYHHHRRATSKFYKIPVPSFSFVVVR